MNGPWSNDPIERVLVSGLGLSGRAAARFLLAHGAGVLGVDEKPADKLDLGDLAGRIELAAPSALPEDLDLVVVSPGVPMDRPLLAEARRRGVPVIAEVELAFPFLNGPVVAITGSNGKSTTTAMTGDMVRAGGLQAEVCGNIGEPLVDKVDGAPGRVFVVELSSFQIEGIITFRPKAAALLNLSEDHLDRYGSLQAYAEAKRRLFRDQDGKDVAVLNADDPETLRLDTRAHRRLFSRNQRVTDGCYADAEGQVIEVSPGSHDRVLFHAADVPLAGVQNLENAMAAALLARAVGVEPAAIREALRAFRGLPHRLQKVGERNGVTFYDDSKGTNPGATMKAIEGFADGTVHLILGGRNKDADLGTLTPMVRRKARRAYLIGEAAEDFAASLDGAVPCERSGSLDRAVQSAAEQARPGDAVVLSPACASFDQFRNFNHRGDVFQDLVRGLGGLHG
ncbi:MAG TPA: UDP-N-acetylmuramoyl-L-alanine--D-glutamate ligase [Thermoanaerobaculia bacterium]|nr:UDP-N-acetylmuramoyl-L-alanine--D-glutamate ligase [Thermoanaerobaculia bacterium]